MIKKDKDELKESGDKGGDHSQALVENQQELSKEIEDGKEKDKEREAGKEIRGIEIVGAREQFNDQMRVELVSNNSQEGDGGDQEERSLEALFKFFEVFGLSGEDRISDGEDRSGDKEDDLGQDRGGRVEAGLVRDKEADQ